MRNNCDLGKHLGRCVGAGESALVLARPKPLLLRVEFSRQLHYFNNRTDTHILITSHNPAAYEMIASSGALIVSLRAPRSVQLACIYSHCSRMTNIPSEFLRRLDTAQASFERDASDSIETALAATEDDPVPDTITKVPTERSFPPQNLPTELRLMVYENVPVESRYCLPFGYGYDSDVFYHDIDDALLTCRAINTGAKSILHTRRHNVRPCLSFKIRPKTSERSLQLKLYI